MDGMWLVTRMPRIDCPVCGRNTAVNKSGQFWPHTGDSPTHYCKGSHTAAPIALLKHPWPCPWCGGEKCMVKGDDKRNAMVCERCHARGPEVAVVKVGETYGDNYGPSLKAWNQRKQ
jgi:transcription elongation factor Elf1